MRRTGITTGLLILLLTLGATASAASAKRLVLTEGEAALPSFATFEMFGERNLEVTTSSGGLGCQDIFKRNGIEVSLLTNSAKQDELEIRRLVGDYEEPCRSFTGNAFMQLGGLGGPLKLGANGVASAGPVAVFIEFEHVRYGSVEYGNVECHYARNNLKGSNTAPEAAQPLEVQLVGPLSLDVPSSSENARHLCPKKAEIDLELEMTETDAGAENSIDALVTR